MADSKITLEYIRTLIWPLFALFVLISFQHDIRGMISKGVELDILGVTIKGASGDSAESLRAKEEELRRALDNLDRKLREQAILNQKLTDEKALLVAENNRLISDNVELSIAAGADLSEILEPAAGGVPSPANEKNIGIASRELELDIQQNLNVAQMILAKPSVKKASEYEQVGFKDILDGRWESALTNFQSAYDEYPTYHNVDEIKRLLQRNIDELAAGDEPITNSVRQALVEKYSWGAPSDIIHSIEEQL